MAVLGGWGKDIYDWAGDEIGGFFHAPWKRAITSMAGPIGQAYGYNLWTTGHVGNANDQIYGQLGMVPFAAAAYFGGGAALGGGLGGGAAGGAGSAAGGGALGAGEIGAGGAAGGDVLGSSGGALFGGGFGGGSGGLFGSSDALLGGSGGGDAIFGGTGAGGGEAFADAGGMDSGGFSLSGLKNYHAPQTNSDGSAKGFERPQAQSTPATQRIVGRSQPYELPTYASPALSQQQNAIPSYSRPMIGAEGAMPMLPRGGLGNPATPFTTATQQGY